MSSNRWIKSPAAIPFAVQVGNNGAKFGEIDPTRLEKMENQNCQKMNGLLSKRQAGKPKDGTGLLGAFQSAVLNMQWEYKAKVPWIYLCFGEKVEVRK